MTRRDGDDGAGGQPERLEFGVDVPGHGPTDDILVARGVRRVYGAGAEPVVALRGLDLAVARGSFVSVVGPSGSGKTTLLQCLSGLDDPDTGTVEVEGEDLHRLPDARRAELRARRVGFVFQALNLVPVFSALENAELPLLLGGTRRKEARRAAREALDRVGLSGWSDHRPSELSGGEQQRVAVARAVAARPVLLFADEPTGSLDTVAADGVVELLTGLHAGGMTLVLVTHDAGVAERAQRRLAMRDGALVGDTDPRPLPPVAKGREGASG